MFQPSEPGFHPPGRAPGDRHGAQSDGCAHPGTKIAWPRWSCPPGQTRQSTHPWCRVMLPDDSDRHQPPVFRAAEWRHIRDGEIACFAPVRFATYSKRVYVLYLNRSEEHTSELQSRGHLVCRLLLEKKNT